MSIKTGESITLAPDDVEEVNIGLDDEGVDSDAGGGGGSDDESA